MKVHEITLLLTSGIEKSIVETQFEGAFGYMHTGAFNESNKFGIYASENQLCCDCSAKLMTVA